MHPSSIKNLSLPYLIFFLLYAFPIYPTPPTSPEKASLPKGFVYLDEIDPTIDQYIIFATKNNFTGKPLNGYKTKRAVCTHEAALALSKAQKEFKSHGLCLRVTDAYRPIQAVIHLKGASKKFIGQSHKKSPSSLPKKKSSQNFVAPQKSPHSRGSSFDVVIINDYTKQRLDFGSSHFGDKSSVYSKNVTPNQHKNRIFLRKVMIKHNFKPYDLEWWHFTLNNEPYPKTYFSFPVQ